MDGEPELLLPPKSVDTSYMTPTTPCQQHFGLTLFSIANLPSISDSADFSTKSETAWTPTTTGQVSVVPDVPCTTNTNTRQLILSQDRIFPPSFLCFFAASLSISLLFSSASLLSLTCQGKSRPAGASCQTDGGLPLSPLLRLPHQEKATTMSLC